MLKKMVRSSPTSRAMVIKFGKPILEVSFGTIKAIATIAGILLFINFFFGIKLFISAIQIRNHLGYFINLIAAGEGDILPTLQAIPVLFFVLINIGNTFLLYKVFDKRKQVRLNWILFILQIVTLSLIVIIFILLIVIIGHIYGAHVKLHNGIVDAMLNYSSNSLIKSQIDRLQIEFQCCGSKKYDEWYTVQWYDDSLISKGSSIQTEGNTPFSCCLMSSLYPCIHHDIENTGKVYLYTPEFNLSISTEGCYKKLRKSKQSVGWIIIGNLVLYSILQIILVICLRFIQTGHFERFRFYGHKRNYTVWLFGCYSGKRNQNQSATEPPEPPPVPPELME